MQEDRAYLAGGEDENGDHHLFATDNLQRAIAAYRDFEARFGNARANDGLADALAVAAVNERDLDTRAR
jgi:hypothetical protein